MNDRPLLIMFVGVPGSGKTTFARQLARKLNAVLLNSDSQRIFMWGSLEGIAEVYKNPEDREKANKLTFGAMDYAANQVLAAGHSVVYDCNSNSILERQIRSQLTEQNKAMAVVVRIKVPTRLAVERLQNRDASHDQRKFSLEKSRRVVDDFISKIEEPTEDENVIYINGQDPFEDQYAIFKSRIEKIASAL